MSHLATIISRVGQRISVNPDQLDTDELFLQLICNLKEYQAAWTDYTTTESELADLFFEQYKSMLIGTRYEYIISK